MKLRGLLGAGNEQQTIATQMLLAGKTRKAAGPRRRRRAKAAPVARAAPGRRSTRATKRPARLVKGSAAAKRYMASIRRKRRR